MTGHPPPPLWEVERSAIIAALRWTGGDVAKAAVVLDIGKTTTYAKIRAYEIPLNPWRVTRAREVGA